MYRVIAEYLNESQIELDMVTLPTLGEIISYGNHTFKIIGLFATHAVAMEVK